MLSPLDVLIFVCVNSFSSSEYFVSVLLLLTTSYHGID
ncbi:hypothetical protein BSTP3_004 [Bacillus phage BSTP3]|nr:hypothetical protein BSTP3_004 [Bacillus phage BSTP3]